MERESRINILFLTLTFCWNTFCVYQEIICTWMPHSPPLLREERSQNHLLIGFAGSVLFQENKRRNLDITRNGLVSHCCISSQFKQFHLAVETAFPSRLILKQKWFIWYLGQILWARANSLLCYSSATLNTALQATFGRDPKSVLNSKIKTYKTTSLCLNIQL